MVQEICDLISHYAPTTESAKSSLKFGLVIPCKFSAVTNSARRSCAHLAASQPMLGSLEINGLRTWSKCSQEWRGAPKCREAGC
jgi:hypothetical protein